MEEKDLAEDRVEAKVVRAGAAPAAAGKHSGKGHRAIVSKVWVSLRLIAFLSPLHGLQQAFASVVEAVLVVVRDPVSHPFCLVFSHHRAQQAAGMRSSRS